MGPTTRRVRLLNRIRGARYGAAVNYADIRRFPGYQAISDRKFALDLLNLLARGEIKVVDRRLYDAFLERTLIDRMDDPDAA